MKEMLGHKTNRNLNKTKAVLEHLERFGTITSWQAIKMYRATRLSAIIFNLRKTHRIDTVMVEDLSSRYAIYTHKGKLKSKKGA